MKIFVIDFSADKTLIELCMSAENELEYEQHDGALAYAKTREFMPDIIVVNYAKKPSHGRMTAMKINERKMTSHIPIYFVGGKEKDNEKVKLFGNPISLSKLKEKINLK